MLFRVLCRSTSGSMRIHNACKCTFEAMEETSEDVYRDVFDVNYFGALRLTKSVVNI